MPRKPRPSCGLRAQLENLSPEGLNAFHKILGENIPYKQMLARMKAELGIQTSQGALSNYYQTGTRGRWMPRTGEKLTVSLSRFELLISCSPLGVVSIEVNELPPATADAQASGQGSAAQPPKG